ncbi:MAG: T9SS type A sorting domain-containing protein [Flavobacteriales bacterium]|nr:MAG: T9SS type A sorting domain-containing protein [Flavobacteriales bacterium]
MKHFLKIACAALSMVPACAARAQCTVASSSGYSVNMRVYPEAVEPSTDDCPWGYNYRVRMRYDIAFSGSNAPASLWTLQGRVACGGAGIYFDLPNEGGSGTVVTSNSWTAMTNCATVTPNDLGCFAVEVDINGPGIPAQTVPCGFSPLPVELIAFSAETDGMQVRLEWATASERNSGHFAVERSPDAQAFEEAARVAAAGSSQSMMHYAAVDERPLPGVSYYRLRQTDLDGTVQFSQVVPVRLGRDEGWAPVPNPSTDGRFRVPADAVGGSLEVIAASGMVVSRAPVLHTDADAGPLPTGVYQVRLSSLDGLVRTARLVIQ